MENFNVKTVSLHHIDKENDAVIVKTVSIEDAENYVKDLTEKMITNVNMREYKVKSSPNPVISQIINIINSNLSVANSESAASISELKIEAPTPELIISRRLLECQKTAQIKYGKITNIKKGSLIQSLIENNSELIYIIALIEHSSFIDENDLIRKMGLPDASKATLKAARIHFNDKLAPTGIYLNDSSKKVSEYWYDGFFDSIESINNISNTKRAYTFIKGHLKNKLAGKSKQDYLEYSNSLNVYFSHNDSFNFDDCLNFVFASEPISSEINIDELKNYIKGEKTKNISFDNVFDVDTTDIKSSLSNNKYQLNSNIELKLKTPPDKIKESIYTCKLNDGQVALAITKVDKKVLEQFNFLDIEL